MRKPFKKEKPFEHLKRKNGESYSAETISNWYVARAYVLNKLKDVAIGPESNEHLQVVVHGDSPLMLSMVRQVALLAHFVNFDETNGNHRSIITIVSDNENVVEELKKEEYLCNFMDHCKYSVNGSAPNNADSFLDIELEIVSALPSAENGGIVVEISENDVDAFLKSTKNDDINSIDTRKAVLLSRIYDLGVLIDNLPAEGIHSVKRYKMALDMYKNNLLHKPFKPLVRPDVWSANTIQAKKDISNLFCSDCFEFWVRGVKQYCKNTEKDFNETWANNIEALSIGEHSRWVVEKLIIGFRPMNKQERIQDERSFGAMKKKYRNRLKTNPSDPVSVDLCSFAELRRINPGDMKYDSFLILAICSILRKLKIKVG